MGHIRRQMKRLLDGGVCDVWYEKRAEKDRQSVISLEMRKKLAGALDKYNLADEKSLLVCAWCTGTRLLDPRHVPDWQRCSHPGCS